MSALDLSDRMSRCSTGELLHLVEHAPRLADVLEQRPGEFAPAPFTVQLTGFMERSGLNAAQLGERSQLSRSFLYQLCSGQRVPGRDIVLRLALVLELSVDETQRMLRGAQRGALYPRVRRDAVLIFALSHHLSLLDADRQLVSLGELPLL